MNKIKRLIIIVFLFSTFFAHAVEQKMIISAEHKTSTAAHVLYELEKFFQEDKHAKELKSKYHFNVEMELLDEYVLVVIKPIQTIFVKNELKLLLQMKYPQAFIVPYSDKEKNSSVREEVKKIVTETTLPEPIKNVRKIPKKVVEKKEIIKADSLLPNIANEWLALLVLAIAGLLLVYRSTRQINKIKKLQEKLESYQEKVENQMDYIGEQYE
jgi:citrate lyase beta subunit